MIMALERKIARMYAGRGVYAPCLDSSCCPSQSAPTLPLRRCQSASDHIQVRQGEHGEQSRRVLRQAPIAHFGKAPKTLDHAEGMLAPSPGGRAQAVEAALVLAQGFGGAGAAVHAVADAALASGHPMKLAPVGLIPIQFTLLPVQQLGQLLEVG